MKAKWLLAEAMRAGVLLQIFDSTELALSLAVGCRRHFQSKPISHCRTVSHWQGQIFSMPNISRASQCIDTSSQIASFISL